MDIMTDHVFGISDPEVENGRMVLTDDMREKLTEQADAFLAFIDA